MYKFLLAFVLLFSMATVSSANPYVVRRDGFPLLPPYRYANPPIGHYYYYRNPVPHYHYHPGYYQPEAIRPRVYRPYYAPRYIPVY